MTPQTPERQPESIFETIIKAPIRAVEYVWHHPIRSAMNFLYITAGLAGLRHLGAFNNLPASGLLGMARTGLDTVGGFTQNRYLHIINQLGENIGGYPTWLSGPAQTFSNATRNLLGPPPATPAP